MSVHMQHMTEEEDEREYDDNYPNRDEVIRIFSDIVNNIIKYKLHFIQLESEELISKLSETYIQFDLSLKSPNARIQLSKQQCIPFYLLFELQNEEDEPEKLTKVFVNSRLGQIWLVNTHNTQDTMNIVDEEDDEYYDRFYLNHPCNLTELQGSKYRDINICKILSGNEIHDLSLARIAIKNYIYDAIKTNSIKTTDSHSLKQNPNRNKLEEKSTYRNGYPSNRIDQNQYKIDYKRCRETIVEEGGNNHNNAESRPFLNSKRTKTFNYK